MDAANRVVGQKVDTPVTVPEKVEAVHDLAADEQVTARVATDLLHRPDAAFKAMADLTAQQMVNRAQVEHATQAAHHHRQPAAPALRGLERSMEAAWSSSTWSAPAPSSPRRSSGSCRSWTGTPSPATAASRYGWGSSWS